LYALEIIGGPELKAEDTAVREAAILVRVGEVGGVGRQLGVPRAGRRRERDATVGGINDGFQLTATASERGGVLGASVRSGRVLAGTLN
jgi:hypothetical protein